MLLKFLNLTPIVYGAILFLSRPVLSDDFSFDTCELAIGQLKKDYTIPIKLEKVDVRFSYKKDGDQCKYFQQARIYKDENWCSNGSAIGCSAESPPRVERWMEVKTDPDMTKMVSVTIWHCKEAKEIKAENMPKTCKVATRDNPDDIEHCCGAPREYGFDKRSILLIKGTKNPYLDANGKEVHINTDWPNFAKHSFYPLYNDEVAKSDKPGCTAKVKNCGRQ